jgi:hypothetical protein
MLTQQLLARGVEATPWRVTGAACSVIAVHQQPGKCPAAEKKLANVSPPEAKIHLLRYNS